MPSQRDRLVEALSDRYTLRRELGRGGMATVYLATDPKHDRPVALKAFRPELAAVMGGDCLLRGIQVSAKLSHPNILPLYDSGEAEGTLFCVIAVRRGGRPLLTCCVASSSCRCRRPPRSPARWRRH